jgi:hypothetical protein
VAVKVTAVPTGNWLEHMPEQLIPAGELVTRPNSDAVNSTSSVGVGVVPTGPTGATFPIAPVGSPLSS